MTKEQKKEIKDRLLDEFPFDKTASIGSLLGHSYAVSGIVTAKSMKECVSDLIDTLFKHEDFGKTDVHILSGRFEVVYEPSDEDGEGNVEVFYTPLSASAGIESDGSLWITPAD